MKRGINRFSVLVTDVSGSEVPGLSASQFTIDGQIGSNFYDSAVLIEESLTPGIYNVDVELDATGQGHLQIDVTTSDFITPDYFTLDVKEKDIDDVYNRIAINFLDISFATGELFATTSLTVKEGDDVIVQIPTNRDLNGFDNFKSTLVFSDTQAVTGANVIGDLEIVNVSEPDGIVTVKIPFTLTDGIVPIGSNRLRVFGDLQARDSGDRITLASFTVNIRRQFTIG